jgi:hypothetical protein
LKRYGIQNVSGLNLPIERRKNLTKISTIYGVSKSNATTDGHSHDITSSPTVKLGNAAQNN